jgi:hypothetical protein
MTDSRAIDAAVARLSTRNWVSFDELQSESGLTGDQLIGMKTDIEAGLREGDPSVRLTSRVDLKSEDFEVGE